MQKRRLRRNGGKNIEGKNKEDEDGWKQKRDKEERRGGGNKMAGRRNMRDGGKEKEVKEEKRKKEREEGKRP